MCRSKYRYSWEEYLNLKAKQKKHLPAETISNNSRKVSRTEMLYQRLKEAGMTVFQCSNVMDLMGWKHRRTKKHILRLVKEHKIYYRQCSKGGRKVQAIFGLVRSG